MANNTLITRVSLRNDVISNWNNSTDKLLKGEVALGQRADNKYEVRIGVGDKTWNELSGSNFVVPAENVIGLIDQLSDLVLSTETLHEDLVKEIADRISSDSALDAKITTINEVTIPEVSSNLMSDLEVTLDESTPESGDILKIYTLKQGGEEVGKINIPKDLVIENAGVIEYNGTDTKIIVGETEYTVQGTHTAGKYIIMITAVSEKQLWILAKDLVDVYTGGDTTTVEVEVSDDNVITASVRTGSITRDLLASDVTDELDVLSGAINTEKSLRVAADEALQNNIDSLSTSVNNRITQEINRATGIEGILSGDLDVAKVAISTNTQNITKNAQDIAAETQRATDAEDDLQDEIDAITTELEDVATKSELSDETEARKTADETLQSQITTISSDYLKSSDKVELEGKITTEETRAKGVEEDLSDKIDAIADDLSDNYETKDDATTKYNELTGLIDAEEDARTEADEALRQDLSVTVETLAEAESGYLKTYVVKQGGVQVGSKINIPKDFVIKDASVKTCTEKDKPVEGLNVGDKYIDLEINVTEGTTTSSHLYLPIKDMVDAYEGASTTTVKVEIGSDNTISASILDGSISYDKLSSDVIDKFDTIDDTLEGLRTDVNTLSTDLDDEIERATSKEDEISVKLDGEIARAKGVEGTLSAEISSKIFIKDPASEEFKDGAYGNLSVLKVTEDEYMAKVADGTLLKDGVLYVISSDHINAYGQKIVNLAEPTLSSDAATKNYVDTQIADTKLTAIELNNLSFTIENNKATLNVDIISCGNAN